MESKTCTNCKLTKPLSDFYYDNQNERHYAICQKCKKLKRSDYRRLEWGVTVKIYNELFQKQGGCCAICGVHQTELKKMLCSDHNHITKEPRGLLCFSCNIALGSFKVDDDRTSLLLSALEYMKQYKRRQ